MALLPRKKTRRAFENFLLAHYERALRVEQVRSRPFVLLLDPASVCQLQCPMCPTGLENAGKVGHGRTAYRSRGLLSREIFDAVLDELGDTLFFVHLYNWGEPLLNKQLPYFIRELVRRDIVVDTNTNLSLPLGDPFIDELLDSGIDRIEASIDGFSQETYGRYRIKGRFELARDNLLKLVAARDRLGLHTQIVWNFLVFRFNEPEIEMARSFCDDHGIEFVRREAALSESLRAEFLPSYREGEVLEGFFEQREMPFDPESIRRRPIQSCGWHYYYSVINADGSVSPCCAPWESDWDFGFVAPGAARFAEIWNGEAVQAARRDVAGHQLLEKLRRTGKLDSIVSVDDLVRQGTICEGCQMPLPMLDLYSGRADLVVSHFFQTSGGRDPFLDRAFELVRSQPDAFVRYYGDSLPEF
ncbi:radical SAM/SPASM domain-containing protein [Ferrovum sp.]|uniref:radical SAM/SPASM domain-containing protein n=1 Tax=Ferrovum sp. TaxID=2609467 RepID=UPI00261A6C75|nr:radical SAM/SPASM domain-containing protein [Ferrovum sp.]